MLVDDPYLLPALVFTITFAAAVGMTSGNFGTLARYRIPMLPFYTSVLFIIWEKHKALKASRKIMIR